MLTHLFVVIINLSSLDLNLKLKLISYLNFHLFIIKKKSYTSSNASVLIVITNTYNWLIDKGIQGKSLVVAQTGIS